MPRNQTGPLFADHDLCAYRIGRSGHGDSWLLGLPLLRSMATLAPTVRGRPHRVIVARRRSKADRLEGQRRRLGPAATRASPTLERERNNAAQGVERLTVGDYMQVRRLFVTHLGHVTHNNARVSRILLGRYGAKQRDRNWEEVLTAAGCPASGP